MFKLESAIAEWRQRMAVGGIRSAKDLDELESHLREELKTLAAAGTPEVEAFVEAVRRLGAADELAQEFVRAGSRGIPTDRAYGVAVKTLAVWFILRGCSRLSWLVAGVFTGASIFGNGRWVSVLLDSVPLFLGVGLLRRKRLYRTLTLIWCAWCLVGEASTLLIPSSHPYSIFVYAPHAFGPLTAYKAFGFSVPYIVFYVNGILGSVFLMFGAALLFLDNNRHYFTGGSPRGPVNSGAHELEQASSVELEENQRLRRFMMATRVAVGAYAIAAILYFHGSERFNPTDRLLGLAAVALLSLYFLAGRHLWLRLPVVASKWKRMAIGLSFTIVGTVAAIIFFNTSLQRLDLSEGRLTVVVLWCMTLLTMAGSVTHGLDVAAQEDRPKIVT